LEFPAYLHLIQQCRKKLENNDYQNMEEEIRRANDLNGQLSQLCFHLEFPAYLHQVNDVSHYILSFLHHGQINHTYPH